MSQEFNGLNARISTPLSIFTKRLLESAARIEMPSQFLMRGFVVRRSTWLMLTSLARQPASGLGHAGRRLVYKSKRRIRRMRKALGRQQEKSVSHRPVQKNGPRAPSTGMHLLALEPRIVFDAAAVATAEHVTESAAPAAEPASAAPDANEADAALFSDVTEGSGAPSQEKHEIAFVDGSVHNISGILAGIGSSVEIVILDTTRDGVGQIAEALRGRTNVDAIHIVSHGSDGRLNLGNAVLDAQSIGAQHAADLTVIRDVLSTDADILIYGCNVASGDSGQDFVSALATATGADIAASNDDTGTATRGGDWDLETRLGLIESGLIDAPEWNGLLAPLEIAVSGNPVLTGPGGGAYNFFNAVGGSALWTNAGTVGGSAIDIRATVIATTTLNAGVNPTPYVGFITSNFEDMQVIVWNGSATIQWEIFASGTNQTVYAVGSPNFSIRDLDGLDAQNLALPSVELEAVVPSLNGLTSYTVEGNPASPSTLATGVFSGDLYVAGTINRNAEPNSMVSFGWTEVSSWTVRYVANTSFVNPDGSISARFYYHDGDGDFTFVAPNTTLLLGIDLDGNNSTAPGNAFQVTFTENGAAVPVVDADAVITQHAALGTQLHEATVRLVNAQAGDELRVNGSTATSGSFSAAGATFNYTVTTSGGQIEVALTGTATPAHYQAALQAITFANTSESPSAVDRRIEVFVTNAAFGTSSNQALSTIHVTSDNDVPVAVDDTFSVAEDGTSGPLNLIGNDTDLDGDTLVVKSIAGTPLTPGTAQSILAANGTVNVSAAGVITFTPAPNYNGPFSFDYVVTDGTGDDIGTVHGTVDSVNDAPAGTDTIVTTPEDTAYTFSAVDFGFSDPDGDAFDHVEIATLPAAGTLLLAGVPVSAGDEISVADIANGLLTFVPAPDASGTPYVNFQFVVCDDSAPSLFTETFGAGPGRASFGSAGLSGTTSYSYDGTGTIDDGDYALVSRLDPSLGSWWNTTNFFTYDYSQTDHTGDPDGRFMIVNASFAPGEFYRQAVAILQGGDYQVSVALSNGNSFTVKPNVTISILDSSGAVAATVDSGNLADYSAANGWQTYALSATLAPGNYTFVLVNNAPGGFGNDLYVDDIRFSANPPHCDPTSNTLTINVTPVEDAPVAVDDMFSVPEDGTSAPLTLIGNDIDLDGDTLSVKSIAGTPLTPGTAQSILVTNGTVNVSAAGVITFTPDANYNGPISFDYVITDGTADDIGTVTGTVDPINDAPVGTPANQVSSDGQAVSIDVGAAFTDIDSADIDYMITGLPVGLSYDPETGIITGTLASNASQGGSGGVYTITIDATDGTATTTQTFTFTVSNPAPVAVADSNTTNENASQISGDVTPGTAGQDHDGGLDSDPLTVTAALNASGGALPIGMEATLPSGAKLTLNADGTYTYKPNGAFEGLDLDESTTDTFSYTISDGQGGTSTATVTIAIDGRNDAPQAGVLPAVSGRDGDTVAINLGALFSDPDIEPLSYTMSGLPPGLTFNPLTGAVTGTIDYTASQTGLFAAPGGGTVYVVQVAASDGDSEITRSFNYTVTNPAPVAIADTNALGEDGPVANGSVVANDDDGANDGDTLTVTSARDDANTPIVIGTEVTLPSGAKLTLNADGSYSYDPNGAFEGLDGGETATDTFSYSISDGQGGTATATVTITINGANDAPVAIDNAGSVTEEGPLTDTGNVITDNDGTGADSDPDGEPLYVTNVNGTAVSGSTTIVGFYGTLVIAPNGSYTYTLDNSNPTVQALQNGETLAENFGYAIADGLTSTVGNGSLEGTAPAADRNTHNALLPPNWSLYQTPDVFNSATNFNGYTWAPTPDGGDFLHALSVGGYEEGFQQVITGLVPGQQYTINFSQSLSANGYGASGSGHWQVTFGSETFDAASMTTPGAGVAAGWQAQSLTFTATGTTQNLLFVAKSDGAGNRVDLGIDGISLGAPGGAPLTASANLAITISGTNDVPVAVNDTGSVGEDDADVTGHVISGAGADTDVDSDPLMVAAAEQGGTPIIIGTPFTVAGGGTLTLNSDGSYAFEPGTAYNGLDAGETATETITYTVDDGNGGTATAMLVITINGANDAPVVIDSANPGTPSNPISATDPLNIIPDVATTDGAPLAPIHVGSFVVDPDGEPLTFTLDPAVPAWVVIDPETGIVTGTPPADASQNSNTGNPGEYLITITATDPDGALATTTVTLSIVNLAPVAQDDDASIGEDAVSVTGNVLTDPTTGDADTAPDSDLLTVAAAEQGGNPIIIGTPFTVAGGGTLTLNSDGSYTFEPGTAYNGLDIIETAMETITYTVDDGNGGTATAQLVITINGANDAPVVIDPANPGTPSNPISASDPLNIIPDVATTDGAPLAPIDVGSFIVDPDGEPLTFTLDPAVPAWVVIDPTTGIITGTPPADASQHSNTGNPGEYLITITATDPDGALVTTTVTLSIVNLAPVAQDDDASIGEDAVSVTGNVITDPLTGDADTAPDSDPLTVTSAEQGGNPIIIGTPFTVAGGGTLTLNSDGSYTFEPGTAYNGLDITETATETITYTVDDGNGGTATAQLIITINGANDAPVAEDLSLTTRQDGPVSGQIMMSDVDGDPLTVTGPINGPMNGFVIVNEDGTFTYQPKFGFSGLDRFVVQVSDGNGGFDLATVTINVLSEAMIITPPIGMTTAEPSVVPATTADSVGGIVLDAVQQFSGQAGTGIDLSVTGIIMDTVNTIARLETAGLASGRAGQDAGPIARIAALSDLAERARSAFPMSQGFWDVHALSGYSVRMQVGDFSEYTSGEGGERIVVDTLMRDRIIFVRVSNTLGLSSSGSVEAYTVLQADGRPLPGWVQSADDGLLLVQAPMSGGEIDLRIIATLADGSTIERGVSLDLTNGSVEELAIDQTPVPLFDQQIKRRNAL